VYKLLQENASQIFQRIGKRLEIKRILELDQKRPLALWRFNQEVLTKNIDEILNDPDIQIVIELLGELNRLGTYIREALYQGKHVVTANKDVVAAYGKELFEAATAGKADFYFGGKCRRGIPVISHFERKFGSNKLKRVIGDC